MSINKCAELFLDWGQFPCIDCQSGSIMYRTNAVPTFVQIVLMCHHNKENPVKVQLEPGSLFELQLLTDFEGVFYPNIARSQGTCGGVKLGKNVASDTLYDLFFDFSIYHCCAVCWII